MTANIEPKNLRNQMLDHLTVPSSLYLYKSIYISLVPLKLKALAPWGMFCTENESPTEMTT